MRPHSLHQLELPRFPPLVEPRLERAVKANDGVPAFAVNGLHPACFVTPDGVAGPNQER